MMTVHALASPNSVKVTIALEDLGLEYQLDPVNIRQGEHKHAAFAILKCLTLTFLIIRPA